MENNSTDSTSYFPLYVGCTDANLSEDSLTSVYWDTANISSELKITSIVMATILLLFLIIGLPSNVILIISIICKHLKQPTHILLLNLAISDVLVCSIFIPFGIVSGYAGGFVLGSNDRLRCQVCQFNGFVFSAVTIASLNTLGLISIDRFVYFKYPLSYHRYVTATKTVFVILLVWLFSAVQSILPLFGFGTIRYTYSTCSCMVYLYGRTHITKNVYYMLLLVLLGLFPVITMVVTNVWIIIIVRKQIKKLYKTRRSFGNKGELKNHQQSLKKEISKTKNKKQLALFRAFGMILIANGITWVPVIILTIIYLTANQDDDVPFGFIIFTFLSFISHSVLHPIIEGCLIPEIKTSFKKVLCPCEKRNRARKCIDALENERRSDWCLRCLDICSFALLSGSQDMMYVNAVTSCSNHAGNRLDMKLDTIDTCE